MRRKYIAMNSYSTDHNLIDESLEVLNYTSGLGWLMLANDSKLQYDIAA